MTTKHHMDMDDVNAVDNDEGVVDSELSHFVTHLVLQLFVEMRKLAFVYGSIEDAPEKLDRLLPLLPEDEAERSFVDLLIMIYRELGVIDPRYYDTTDVPVPDEVTEYWVTHLPAMLDNLDKSFYQRHPNFRCTNTEADSSTNSNHRQVVNKRQPESDVDATHND